MSNDTVNEESGEEIKPFCFELPGSLIISGVTGVGKSHLCAQIVKYRNEIICPKPTVIIWVYNVYQSKLFDDIKATCPECVFVHGWDEFKKITLSKNVNHLLIIDDLISLGDSKEAVDLFTCKVHHYNIFLIYLIQSMYYRSKFNALLMRQAKYIILFQNKRNS